MIRRVLVTGTQSSVRRIEVCNDIIVQLKKELPGIRLGVFTGAVDLSRFMHDSVMNINLVDQKELDAYQVVVYELHPTNFHLIENMRFDFIYEVSFKDEIITNFDQFSITGKQRRRID